MSAIIASTYPAMEGFYSTTIVADPQHQCVCHWRECSSAVSTTIKIFDVYMQTCSFGLGNKNSTREILALQTSTGRAKDVLEYLLSTSRNVASQITDSMTGIKLLLPNENGYLVRSDILRQRLHGCDIFESVSEFVSSEDHLNALQGGMVPNLLLGEILGLAIGAITARQARNAELPVIMDTLSNELVARLSCPFITSPQLSRNRLVVVGSRHQLVMENWFESAYQLGVKVTLIGAQGHFLAVSQKCYPAVEQFIAIDMSLNDDLPSRIVQALGKDGSDFHGITTFKDPYLIPVAKAAKMLNLPTAPIDAVSICIDKHLTRVAVCNASESLRVKGLADLKQQMSNTTLKYPLIVKPCTGYGSEGVFKIIQETDLFNAVSKLETTTDHVDILIDSYAEGPEIDANFVLYDGELLFFELVDGLPCTAEDSKDGNFLETDQMWPSNHPARESNMLRTELLARLLRLGFKTGVFHVEARIQDSAMQYNVENEVRDLRPRKPNNHAEPSYFLLEINQRPPGHGGISATKWAHGIDYLGIYSMCALADENRVKALSQPFAFAEGAQGWCDSVFINASHPGVYDGGDIPSILRTKHADLVKEVVFSACYYQDGDTVVDDPPRVALFVVASKISRLHVRQVAQRLRDMAQSYVKMR